MGMRKRIALINQRCGVEVNGGSEQYTLNLARHLKSLYDVEIITTKALDYKDWANYYENDVDVIDDIVVIRFDVSELRDPKGMDKYFPLALSSRLFKQRYEYKWIDACGPQCPSLIEHIRRYEGDYDALIFVTYLYYPVVYGIGIAPEKTILLPTAHDEPFIYLDVFREVFSIPRAFIYLTPEEKEFVENLFEIGMRPSCVAGSGVDLPEAVDEGSFRRKFGIIGDYLVYAGRIDEGKSCDHMLALFRQYKDSHSESDLKLVLMGKTAMEIPEADDIVYVGFVSEQDKYDGISGALALWLPSRLESLSIAVLEALSLGVPVMVNGDCAVLEGHCRRSGAGWAYKSEDEAVAMLAEIAALPDRNAVAEKARSYIANNFTWDITIDRVSRVIDGVIRANEARG